MSIEIMIAIGVALALGAATVVVAMINHEVNASLAAFAPQSVQSEYRRRVHMTRALVHRIYGLVFALLLCTTVVGVTSQSARFDNVPSQAAETPMTLGNHGLLQPLW
jgi:Mg2+/Co2+ transporter CorB